MSGNLPSGVTDADIDRAAAGPDEWPCQWDEDGYCRTCGAGPNDECEFDPGLGLARLGMARHGVVRRGLARLSKARKYAS